MGIIDTNKKAKTKDTPVSKLTTKGREQLKNVAIEQFQSRGMYSERLREALGLARKVDVAAKLDEATWDDALQTYAVALIPQMRDKYDGWNKLTFKSADTKAAFVKECPTLKWNAETWEEWREKKILGSCKASFYALAAEANVLSPRAQAGKRESNNQKLPRLSEKNAKKHFAQWSAKWTDLQYYAVMLAKPTIVKMCFTRAAIDSLIDQHVAAALKEEKKPVAKKAVAKKAVAKKAVAKKAVAKKAVAKKR
jgi:hypothetical protein